MNTPRLITPTGKTVELSQELYKEIQKLLREQKQTPTAKRPGHVAATYGKYAGKPSLIEALLRERKLERAWEESTMRR